MTFKSKNSSLINYILILTFIVSCFSSNETSELTTTTEPPPPYTIIDFPCSSSINKLIIESMIALLEHDRKVGEIAQKALDQTITPSEAYSQMSALPNPFANVRTFFNSAPTETAPLDRGGAMDILKQEGVID